MRGNLIAFVSDSAGVSLSSSSFDSSKTYLFFTSLPLTFAIFRKIWLASSIRFLEINHRADSSLKNQIKIAINIGIAIIVDNALQSEFKATIPANAACPTPNNDWPIWSTKIFA